MNYLIEQYKRDIANITNSYAIPIEVKRLVLFEIYQDVKSLADSQIEKERQEAVADEQSVPENSVGELSE